MPRVPTPSYKEGKTEGEEPKGTKEEGKPSFNNLERNLEIKSPVKRVRPMGIWEPSFWS